MVKKVEEDEEGRKSWEQKWKEEIKGKVEHRKRLENERKESVETNGLENMGLNYNKRMIKRKEIWRHRSLIADALGLRGIRFSTESNHKAVYIRVGRATASCWIRRQEEQLIIFLHESDTVLAPSRLKNIAAKVSQFFTDYSILTHNANAFDRTQSQNKY